MRTLHTFPLSALLLASCLLMISCQAATAQTYFWWDDGIYTWEDDHGFGNNTYTSDTSHMRIWSVTPTVGSASEAWNLYDGRRNEIARRHPSLIEPPPSSTVEFQHKRILSATQWEDWPAVFSFGAGFEQNIHDEYFEGSQGVYNATSDYFTITLEEVAFQGSTQVSSNAIRQGAGMRHLILKTTNSTAFGNWQYQEVVNATGYVSAVATQPGVPWETWVTYRIRYRPVNN